MKIKILTPRAHEAKSEGRLVALPVKLCEPHPDLQTRLKYDQVDRLAKDIKVHHQLQPGRAVEKADGTGFLVYMGIGRLFAVRKLFDEFGEPKSYFALLDEGLPFIDLFSRSMSENLKRRNLSVLEEVRSYFLASLKASETEIVKASEEIGEDPGAVRKKVELARSLGDRLGRLYEIEGKEGFSFQLGHLEALAKMGDQKEFYQAAASTAFARFKVHELQASLRNRSIERVALGLPTWFGEMFPEFAGKEGESQGPDTPEAVSGPPGTDGTIGRSLAMVSRSLDLFPPTGLAMTPKATHRQHPPAGVPYMERLCFAACPYCGAYTPYELRDGSELTVIRFDGSAVPRKETVAPEGSFRETRACFNPECREEFWLWVTETEGEPRVETRRKDGDDGWFSLPSGRPVVGSVSWSEKRGSWVVRTEGDGGLYLYGESGKLVDAVGEGI